MLVADGSPLLVGGLNLILMACNLGVAGIRCIENDDCGKWIGKLASPLLPTSNNLAELEVLDKGLQLYINLGVTKVIIERDSQIILNALRKSDTPN